MSDDDFDPEAALQELRRRARDGEAGQPEFRELAARFLRYLRRHSDSASEIVVSLPAVRAHKEDC